MKNQAITLAFQEKAKVSVRRSVWEKGGRFDVIGRNQVSRE